MDSSARQAVLIPLRSPLGLCVLVLLDKQVDEGNSLLLNGTPTTEHSLELVPNYISFSDCYVESIQKSGVCEDLLDVLRNLHVVLNNEAKAVDNVKELEGQLEAWRQKDNDKAFIIQKMESRIDGILKLIPKYSNKELLQNSIRKWRLFVTNRATITHQKKYTIMLEGIKELINVKNDCREEEVEEKFVSILERRLSLIFPLDSVDLEEKEAYRKEEISDIDFDLDGSQIAPDVRKSHLTAKIICNYPSSNGNAGIEQKSFILANIVITRKSASTSFSSNKFDQDEVSMFHEFCDIASDVYTALQRGVQDDFRPGHSRSLVFPMLRELIPAILPLNNGSDGPTKRGAPDKINRDLLLEGGLLPLLTRWLKKITNADIVVMNLKGDNDSSISEVHCTSEDSTKDFPMHSTEQNLHTLVQVDKSNSTSSNGNSIRVLLKTEGFGRNDKDKENSESDIKIYFPRERSSSASDEQLALVEVVSYILVYSIRCSRTVRRLTIETSSLLEQLGHLNDRFSTAQRELSLMGASDNSLKFKLSSLLALQKFIDNAYSISNLTELARYVSNILPQIFGTESAVLILKDFSVANNESQGDHDESAIFLSSARDRNDGNEKFFVVLPVSDDDSDKSKIGHLDSGDRKSLTLQKLQKIDNYFQNRSSNQSKIELRHLSSKSRKKESKLFGAILLFESELQAKEMKSDLDWTGIDEIVTQALSSAVYYFIKKMSQAQRFDLLSRESDRLRGKLEAKEKVESQFEDIVHFSNELKEERDKLHSEASALKEQLNCLINEGEIEKRNLKQELATWRTKCEEGEEEFLRASTNFKEAVQNYQKTLHFEQQNHSNLMDVIRGYVLDHRCTNRETVIDWLRDTAEGLKLALVCVSQTETGDLEGFGGIRGAAAAVGEALRTGQVVEFASTTTLNKSSSSRNLLNNLESFERGFQLPKVSAAASVVNLEVLCVPNRLAAHTKGGSVGYACFLFIREEREGDGLLKDAKKDALFHFAEKDVLICATDLTCRILFKAVAKYTTEDFRKLEMQLKSEQNSSSKLRMAFKYAEKVFQH